VKGFETLNHGLVDTSSEVDATGVISRLSYSELRHATTLSINTIILLVFLIKQSYLYLSNDRLLKQSFLILSYALITSQLARVI
jgi:hypothetical protein